jgi:hypothetical protein
MYGLEDASAFKYSIVHLAAFHLAAAKEHRKQISWEGYDLSRW